MNSPTSQGRPASAAGWPVAPANAQHLGQRDSQQDAFGFSNFSNVVFARHGGYLAVLADGMGGLANGVWASAQSVRLFIEAYQAKSEDESPADALRRAVHVANAVVHDEAERLKLVDRMGTTLVAAVVRDSELHWISVGDSRVYLFEAGQLRCLSVDHSYGEVLRQQVARGEISLSEAQAHPMRHALTSYLGRPEPLAVDASTAPLRITAGAWVLLCSDGLSGVLTEADMAAQLHGEPQQACDRLLQAAISRGLKNQDNTTVVLLHVPRCGAVAHAHAKTQARYGTGTGERTWWRRAGSWGVAASVLVTMTCLLGAWVAVQRLSASSPDADGLELAQTLPASDVPAAASSGSLSLGIGPSLSIRPTPADPLPKPKRDEPRKPDRSPREPAASAEDPSARIARAKAASASTTAGLAPDAVKAVAERAAQREAAASAAKAAVATAARAAASAPGLAASAPSAP